MTEHTITTTAVKVLLKEVKQALLDRVRSKDNQRERVHCDKNQPLH